MQFGGTRGSGTDAELLGNNCGGPRSGGTAPDLLRKFGGFRGKGTTVE